jgi:bifunctional non-homologous end joining protein LigD
VYRPCEIPRDLITGQDLCLPDFHRLLGDGATSACLYVFDLLAINGEDLKRTPLVERRKRLARLVRKASPALRFSEHLEGDGRRIFEHACRLGLEGIRGEA